MCFVPTFLWYHIKLGHVLQAKFKSLKRVSAKEHVNQNKLCCVSFPTQNP
jgi:hypothetical protein